MPAIFFTMQPDTDLRTVQTYVRTIYDSNKNVSRAVAGHRLHTPSQARRSRCGEGREFSQFRPVVKVPLSPGCP